QQSSDHQPVTAHGPLLKSPGRWCSSSGGLVREQQACRTWIPRQTDAPIASSTPDRQVVHDAVLTVTLSRRANQVSDCPCPTIVRMSENRTPTARVTYSDT